MSRTINGEFHVLRNPVLGPLNSWVTNYAGPTDWQGNPAIGDPYIDSLNFNALTECETGVSGGNPWAINGNDSDGGGARYGAYQIATGTWHYAVDLDKAPEWDPYQDPRDAPMWYQTYREKRLLLKELIRGPGQAWRWPPQALHQSCGWELFTGPRPSNEVIS